MPPLAIDRGPSGDANLRGKATYYAAKRNESHLTKLSGTTRYLSNRCACRLNS
jgi:hypothetical protein